jgi:hypothetical protein
MHEAGAKWPRELIVVLSCGELGGDSRRHPRWIRRFQECDSWALASRAQTGGWSQVEGRGIDGEKIVTNLDNRPFLFFSNGELLDLRPSTTATTVSSSDSADDNPKDMMVFE